MHAMAKTATIRQSLTNGENGDNSPNFTLSSQNAHVDENGKYGECSYEVTKGPHSEW